MVKLLKSCPLSLEMVIKAAAGRKPSSQGKLLMAELTRCLGYFNPENTVFKWSHLSDKCVQDEDK